MNPNIVRRFVAIYESVSKTESELDTLYRTPLTLEERIQCENLFKKITEMKNQIKNILPFPIE